MGSGITALLWHTKGSFAETLLIDRPLWWWTLAALRGLRPARILLVSTDEPPEPVDGVEALPARRLRKRLAGLKGKLVVLSTDLPCIRSSTLKRLLGTTRSAPRCLIGEGQEATQAGPVICCAVEELASGLARLRRDGLVSFIPTIHALPTETASSDDLLEVRNLRDWSRAAQTLRRRKCESLLATGVYIDDPSTVHIDPEVRVGKGTHIRGWVVIEGRSRIGAHCQVGSFTHIIDSQVGARTVLLDHCFIRSSRIGSRCQLGPFAHLRPESVLGTRAKVGNFVELKKTTLGPGSKTPHLTYLGDALVGRRVNVGAGTITCNYDGESKYQTVIGDGAFIGSDVQLVAPVRVGREAYVAAGSCIVEDVPAAALALARSRQVVKPGWARRKRKKKHP